MILADSSVVIDWLRLPSLPLRETIRRQEAVICGVTVAEVRAGCRNDVERARTEASLAVFRRIEIPESVWPVLGDVLGTLRRSGTPLPFPDLLIASVASVHGIELWARDKHFRRMTAVLPGLRIFDARSV